MYVFVFTFHLAFLASATAQCGIKVKAGDRAAYNAAVQQIESHRYKDGAKAMRRLAGRNPKAADPQFWLGMAAVGDGYNAAGIRRYFTHCIELCPNYPNAAAHFYMAVIYYTDNRFDDAVAELNNYFQLANGSEDKTVTALYDEASNYLYWSQFLSEAMLNKAPFDPKPVKGVSSQEKETLPFLTADGQTFYYLRELPVKQEHTFYNRDYEEKHWQLCYSKLLDTVFSAGLVLPPPFNSGDPEGSVSLTADGRELYFSIIRRVNGYANSDIYCVRNEGGRWSQPENCGQQVNGDRTWESQPTVSADGKTLIFASNRKGGQGGSDLWRCHRLKNGDWSRAENLGHNVNTTGNERFPFLAADGHTLYFLSDGWQGFGGYDVYFVDLDDKYGNRPTNLGLPINSEDDELSFGVTTDGRQAYFAGRTANSRSTDILMFDLYPAARPEPMTLCRLTVTGPRASRDTLLVLPEQNNAVVLFADSLSLPLIRCGKARDFRMKGVAINDTLSPIGVTFLSGSHLTPEGELVVDALADWLIEHPRVHICVECPKQNDARTVYERLRAKGLRVDRLSYRGGTDIAHPQIRLTANRQ